MYFFFFIIKICVFFMVVICKILIICLFNFYYEVVSENIDKEDMCKRYYNFIVLFYYIMYMYLFVKGF